MNLSRKFNFPDAVILAFLGIITLVFLFPFYQTVILSFSKAGDLQAGKVFIFPVSFDLSAYEYLIEEGKMVRGAGVTIFITILGTFLSLSVTTAGAYALTKKAMPGRNLIMNGIILTMFFGGGLIPYFLTVQKVGLANNVLVMIIPVMINTFNLVLMKNFLSSIPLELEESAKIDGANEIIILIRIIVPVSAPIIATIALFYAVDRWNEWWHAMIFINDTTKYPLQLVLREAIVNITKVLADATAAAMAERTRTYYQESVKAAIIVVSAVPILLVYPFLQRHFVKGIMIGSIKG
ncbi:MAG: carbohydrate ABC transporter permease [Treponema sp.]|jgi:putative aldouronate transport system permease protein|nr:carbohydrate ABC transporter permease [Treponema sp.]